MIQSSDGPPDAEKEPRGMSLEQSETTQGREPIGDAFAERATDHPVVGLFVDATTSADAVAGTILRTRSEKLPVIVAHAALPEHEAIGFANQLGVPVVDAETFHGGEQPHEAVATLARKVGFPAVVWCQDPAERIDFEGTLAALDDRREYVVEPTLEPKGETNPDLLVGIPAYNEAETIGDVVRGARATADDVLVVDDGSDDRTVAEAREAGATVIEHETNQGYGAALKTVFTEAERCGTDYLVILDGDGQHDPADIPKLVQEQRDNDAELVIGSRFIGEAGTDAPLYRRLGLFVVNTLTNLSFGVLRPRSWISDTQSGFRAYDHRAIENLAADDGIDDRMSASTDILHHAHINDYDVREVGTTVNYDVENGSTHHPVSHGITLVTNILRTVERERPISMVGIPGFVSVFAGLGFGYLTVSNYIATGTFPMGLAITSAFFSLAGIFTCFTAIILHSLNTLDPA